MRHLHDGHMPKWITSNLRMDSSEFTAEAKTWLSIICSRIIPSKKESDVSVDWAVIICAIMEGLDINVGELILQQILEVVTGNQKSILSFFDYSFMPSGRGRAKGQ